MKKNDEMMFELDEFQQYHLDDWETKDWLEKIIRRLSEKQFPLLHANIDGKDLDPILDRVIADARKYGFENDDMILVRYGVYAVNNGVTPMDNPELEQEIRKSETVPLGNEDQVAVADWAARNYELVGMEVEWE